MPQVVACGAVSAALFVAFAAVSGGDTHAAEAAIAARAAELLRSMAGPSGGGGQDGEGSGEPHEESGLPCRGGLLTELAALAADADPSLLGPGSAGSSQAEGSGGGGDGSAWWLAELDACAQVGAMKQACTVCGGD